MGTHLLFFLLIYLGGFIAESRLFAADKKHFNDTISLEEISKTSYYTKILDAHYIILNGRIVHFPEQFIINIPQAQVLCNRGMVLTSNNRPFFDYVQEKQQYIPDWKLTVIKKTFEQYTHKPELFTGSLAILASPGEQCYYHWMFEIFPRLKVIQLSGITFDKIFLGLDDRKYKKECLEQLGYTDNQTIYGKLTTAIKADNIIIPSMPNLTAVTRPNWVIDFLRASFLNDASKRESHTGKKLYISRKKPSYNYSQRIIVNEEAVFNLLKSHGFEKVYLEDLPVQKQAQLFNSAETIIAVHGASLTNLVFCNDQYPVKVIEIYNPKLSHECYVDLTAQMNKELNFKFKHIRMRTSDEKLSDIDIKVQNIYIEIAQLKTLLSIV